MLANTASLVYMSEFNISIITATYNADRHLPRLVASLQAQTCRDFEWVVADGGSTDGTLKLLHEVADVNLIIDSRSDFGIYDALNRAIKLCSGTYYLVVGADDILYDDAVFNYLRFVYNNSPDIVFAPVLIEGRGILYPKLKNCAFFRYEPFVGEHAVGMLIRKELHNLLGFYSKSFPIAADTFFIKKAINNGSRIELADFVAGVFGTAGVSSSNYLRVLCESFQVSMAVGENKAMHLLVFILKLLKNFSRL